VEIGHFIRSRPRISALALLFPVLAALAAVLVLANQPPRYTAVANVAVPSSAANSASRVGLYVADFAQVAVSDPVVSKAAQSTGVPQADIKSTLEVTRLGQSSLFSVTYTGNGRENVEPVVRAVITDTFNSLVQVDSSDAALAAATKAYQDAVQARADYQDQIGTLQPESDYTDLSSRIRSLELAPQTFANQAAIRDLTTQRDALVPQIRKMQELDQAVTDTASQRDEAARAAESVQQDAAQAQSAETIQNVSVTPESRATRMVQGAGVAAVAGLLVGVAILVLPDVLRRREQPLATRQRNAPSPRASLGGATEPRPGTAS
jgi:hypothetical protein